VEVSGALLASAVAGALVSVDMIASLPPASTVLPSSASSFVMTPAAGAGTSTDTLSVSNSHSISSASNASPGFLNQLETVASVTLSPKVGTMTSISSPPDAAGASAAAGAAFSALAGAFASPPADICASRASTPTVSPSPATISDKVPAAGAGTSTVTLSVSSSHSISSCATVSPGFLNQVATVASVTLSPRVGTRTSVIISILRWSARHPRAPFVVLCAGTPDPSQVTRLLRGLHRPAACVSRQCGSGPIRC